MAERVAEVLVVGLGRFGGAVAQTLVELEHEVLAVDSDPKLVQAYADVCTHVVEADATDAEAMRQLGAAEFETAVVAIGTDLESSILATSVLHDFGVETIWAKAITEAHGRILERVGAHHVVFPERDMGVRVAHRVSARIIEYVELDPGFAIVETRPPRDLFGKKLGETRLRQRYGVTIVCVKPTGGSFTYATPETVLGPDDVIVAAGETERVREFAQRA